MSNIKKIEEKLKKLLVNFNDNGFVSSISGEWGVGKTYFWKNFIKKEKEYTKDHIYISLFGLESIEQIKEAILYEFTTAYDRKQVQKFAKSVGKIKLLDIISVNVGGLLTYLLNDKISKILLICFDDIERISYKLPMKEFMGFISELKEEHHCRIILIFNENELDKLSKIENKKHSEILSLYKEKIVDYEFSFLPAFDEIFDVVKQDIKVFDKQFIRDYFKTKDIKNIRVMKQCIRYLNELDFLEQYIDNMNISLLNKFLEFLLNHLVLKIACGFSEEKYNFFADYESDRNSNLDEIIDELGLEKKDDKDFKKLDEFERCLKYIVYANPWWRDIEIAVTDYIYKMKLNKKAIIDFLQNNRYQRWLIFKKEVEKIETNYIYDLNKTKESFTKELENLFNKNTDLLSMFNLDIFKKYIEYIDDESLKETFLKKYISNQIETQDQESINKRNDVDKFIEKFPDMKDYVDKHRNSYTLECSIEDFIKSIVNQQGYLSKKQEILLEKNKNLLKEEIKKSKEIFIDISKLNSNTIRDIKILNDVLQEIAKENKLYKEKLQKIGLI